MLWIRCILLPSLFWRLMLPEPLSIWLLRIFPIQTVFTRIWADARSLLIAFVNARPAARLTEVGSEEAGGVLAAEVVIFTIEPPPP